MNKTLRKFLGIALAITLLFTGLTPIINAETESLTQSSVVISDSAPDVQSNYTFEFTTASDVPSDGDIRLDFPDSSWVTNVSASDVTCPTGTSARVESNRAYCEPDSEALAAGTHQIEVDKVQHPSKSNDPGIADTYTIEIATRETDTTKIERAQVMVALVEPITVKATVDASLLFEVTGVAADETVHGLTTDHATDADRVNFEVLEPDVPKVLAQDLSVATNASDGFSVTIFQDGNLINADGDEISSFKDDTPVATSAAEAWAAPSATLDEEHTYGHFGFTSEDLQVSDTCLPEPADEGSYFEPEGSAWAGFDGTSVEEIMCHVGPSDGTTEHKGTTRIGFQAEVSALQPAGEYRNTLTYIATPTF